MDKWFFEMKTVPQQGLGCALACVATIAGVSFDEAKKAAFPRDWRDRGGFWANKTLELDEDRVRAAFRRLGWQARPVDDFRRRKAPSVVFLTYGQERYPGQAIHAVVWDPFTREFRDPGSNWAHKDEIIQQWRWGGFRSVTVTGRLPGAGPAPERAAGDVPLARGVSVDPETGEDDADVAEDVRADNGLCGCPSCRESRRPMRLPRRPIWTYDMWNVG